jgi:hypothetical protein
MKLMNASGDRKSKYYLAAERAIEKEWNIKPLYVLSIATSLTTFRFVKEAAYQ